MVLIVVLLILAAIVGVGYLAVKTGGFLLDGMTSLLNRFLDTDFSNSEVLIAILFVIAAIFSFTFLCRIYRGY
ncbi:MAG: hypothetical protein K2I06_11195 [Ruminococcus sp.]|nr:hypothetical protein [Ruminococcus sp.]